VELQWAVTDSFSLFGGFALQKSELSDDFCLSLGTNGKPLPEAECVANDPAEFTPSGTRLPSTAEFKGNLTGRYEFSMGSLESHLQASLAHEGDRRTALLESENSVLGDGDAYTLVDLSFGVGKEHWQAELFVKNALDENASLYNYAECAVSVCGGIVYSIVTTPRTIGLKYSHDF